MMRNTVSELNWLLNECADRVTTVRRVVIVGGAGGSCPRGL